MDDFLQIAVGTFTMRPYVFAFLAVYLVAAVLHLGWRTTLLFMVCGYLVSFASELCSINTGFPYGWYYYLDATKDRELWIAGVPFFDSLSYVFLCYCSYATALWTLSPVKSRKWDIVPLETRAIRRSFAALLLGSLYQTFLDIIIDPVSLQGSRWFLGQIYGYREPGLHFGVPVSNYLGWWLVSGVMIFVLQRIDSATQRRLSGDAPPCGVRYVPGKALLGPVLYLSVVIFNLTVAWQIGERLHFLTGVFIYTLPTAIVLVLLVRRANRYGKDELAEHLHDYPWSSLTGRKG
ncbi:carotenoid biosynthesis protein [Geomobilimonas luticola]|uniref:Carotenoid biosynthesis protein n=1 Tax=Geomobilimonas luticola TaxID=1114878 RepID=A0ABS5SHR5_9BACT|nr:carotenoid biosynthesis protein [Geomobilimonas luticola]MBT0654272.1 carotenoid biosynthesis protein [Geomobilimonas luticola]